MWQISAPASVGQNQRYDIARFGTPAQAEALATARLSNDIAFCALA
jgi:hypothetical protein